MREKGGAQKQHIPPPSLVPPASPEPRADLGEGAFALLVPLPLPLALVFLDFLVGAAVMSGVELEAAADLERFRARADACAAASAKPSGSYTHTGASTFTATPGLHHPDHATARLLSTLTAEGIPISCWATYCDDNTAHAACHTGTSRPQLHGAGVRLTHTCHCTLLLSLMLYLWPQRDNGAIRHISRRCGTQTQNTDAASS